MEAHIDAGLFLDVCSLHDDLIFFKLMLDLILMGRSDLQCLRMQMVAFA